MDPSQNNPTEQSLPHKLAAILYADVEGYSRLTGADESGTHRTLSAYLDLFAETIKAHRGEVKHYAGDAVLADFSTVSDALNCAVSFQKTIKEKNEAVPTDKRVQFRIGLNLGEVIVDRGEVYGNGVNVAARLETLAEPGGICASGTVVDAIGAKLPFGYEFLGEKGVKNIDRPVRAYRVHFEGSGNSGGVLDRTGHIADPVLAMPTGPSIAVLPFTNMSGDPKEDYFSDGLTEDIITELSRFRDLYVLARNTTFQYKGQAVDVPSIGKKLGVKYMLEGSVRRSGDRVRITAQLIDTISGAHLWADRYDRNLTDIFATQDEIAGKIVATIAGGYGSVLENAAREGGARKRPADLQAYDLLLRANGWVFSLDGYREGKSLLERAIALDPNYARARAQYVWHLLIGWIFRFEDQLAPPAELVTNAIKAATLDPSDHRAHRAAAFGYFFDHQLHLFEQEATLATSMAPNDAQVLAEMGAILAMSGQWERGVQLVTKADALNPVSASGWYHTTLFYDFFRRELYQQGIDVIRLHPGQTLVETQQKYVPVYAELGMLDKAREHWNRCVELDADFSIDRIKDMLTLWNFPEDFSKRYLESFAKAGYK